MPQDGAGAADAPGEASGEATRFVASQYQRMLELSTVLSAETGVTEASVKLIRAAGGIVGAERVTLYVVDRLSAELFVSASGGLAGSLPASETNLRVPLDGTTFVGRCATVRRLAPAGQPRPPTLRPRARSPGKP